MQQYADAFFVSIHFCIDVLMHEYSYVCMHILLYADGCMQGQLMPLCKTRVHNTVYACMLLLRMLMFVQGEMNDMRLLLEEQTSRNTLLEKKQKKFDSELAMVSQHSRHT